MNKDDYNYKEYRYAFKVEWNGGDEPSEIKYTNLMDCIINHDYIKNRMPVMYLYAQIPKPLLDEMINKREEATIIVTINRYEWKGDRVDLNTEQKYLSYEFIYFIPDDINYRRNIESLPVVDKPPEKSDIYTPVLLGLLLERCINEDKKKMMNYVFSKVSKTDLALYTTMEMGKLLMEPFDNDGSIDINIPPMTSVAEILKYINNQSSFYTTDYRFYIDYDRAYLVSNKGINTQASDETIKSVIFNINDPAIKHSKIMGNAVDKDMYICELDANMTEYYEDNKTDNIYNKIISIDSMGNKSEVEIKSGKTSTSGEKPIIIRSDNPDRANMKKNALESSQVLLRVVKGNIDSSVFTINKEYNVNNFEDYKKYDGKYILIGKQEIFSREQVHYSLNVSLVFKKIL